MKFINLVLPEKFVESSENRYKLLTSQTDEEIMCPDQDFSAKKISKDEVEIKLFKNCKITTL